MYILIKTNNKFLIIKSIKTTNSIKMKINKKQLIINNQDIIDQFYLNKVNLLIQKLAKKILGNLETEDDDEESIFLYDELAKLRQVILIKYEKNMSKEAILIYMKNIRFLSRGINKKTSLYNNKTNTKQR